MTPPMSFTIVQKFGRDPFLVLISCLLSLRTRDTETLPASLRLFKQAVTPHELLELSTLEIEHLIYPVGFYRRKAVLLHEVSHAIIERFGGKVPNSLPELLSIRGIGLKTANLVLAEGFGIPAICVDVHVHRISNRLGLVQTKTPEQTEAALRGLLPQEYWIRYNRLMVMWGQNICVPVSPKCSECAVFTLCERVGVTKSR
ncbi:MAG: endonuclease III [Candidatus Babeliales bacterium]